MVCGNGLFLPFLAFVWLHGLKEIVIAQSSTTYCNHLAGGNWPLFNMVLTF